MMTLFNDNWTFAEASIPEEKMYVNGKPNLLSPADFYDTSKTLPFSPVTIPHDWMITKAKALYRNSIGFYKKTFTLTKDDISSRALFLQFEGVYMNSGIWINNQYAGGWKYGYSTFEIDLTPFVKEGTNEILVICVYQNCNTRWYSGAGIFRDVNLINKPETFIPVDGNYLCAKKEDEEIWTLTIGTEVKKYKNRPSDDKSTDDDFTPAADGKLISRNLNDYKLSTTLTDFNGNVFLQTPLTSETVTQIKVKNPLIWDIEKPDYYIAKTDLYDKDGKIIDSVTCNFGFKTISFDKNKGFFLNGKHVVINGACHHHDHGALGSAFSKNALRRQFLMLKEMGINSVRCSHNPPPKAWMDLADELGLLIDDEIFDMWEMPKTPFDYGNYFNDNYKIDIRNWVKKDRNHPSLLMWSIGNEIFDTVGGNGLEITKKLYKEVLKYDPLRVVPITSASNYMMDEKAQKCGMELDLVGYNYLERLYDEHHKKYPDWVIYGSETASTVQSRGIYHFPETLKLITFSDGQCSSLGNCTVPWGAKNTQAVITEAKHKDFCFGQYIWTGWDYIGEPTPYHTKNSYFGQIDTAGFPKDTFYLYKSEWNKKAEPFVHLLPYWDFNEGQLIDIKAYTNAASVELFINGKSFGKKDIDHENSPNPFGQWQAEYHKGEIKAVGYNKDGNIIAEDVQKTPEDPSKIILSPENYDTENLFFIDLMVQDKNGTPVENARNYITVEVSGDAVLCGLDNGDSTDYEEYVGTEKKHTRRLFSNRLVAIVRAKNKLSSFTVQAASKDLTSAALSYKDGKWESILPDSSLKPENDFIPVRKIEISCEEKTDLNPSKAEVKVSAKVLPENASLKEINWNPVLPECVSSDFIEVSEHKGKGSGTESAVIKAKNDGECILRCTARNNTELDEVMSDLPFTVTGFGNSNRNPFTLIEACRFDSWGGGKEKPIVCLESGISTRNNGESWISFDKVDFGKEGADSIHIPIFSFMTELPVEVFDGTPENGKSLGQFTYKHESIYNVYSENVFTLERRLFGVHTISFFFKNDVYFKGFYFDKTPKAKAKLCALDADSVTGDSFTKTEDAVTKIGNNVSLIFSDMSFSSASRITIFGRAKDHANSINIKILGADGSAKTERIEFARSDDYTEQTFELGKIQGKVEVSFIFLPGSNFDFKWFRFE